MDKREQFEKEVAQNIKGLGEDRDLRGLSNIWIREITRHKYSYNFSWLGRPIIQLPQDILALQEIIWSTRPDLIIETGVAHGGSLIFYASMMELLGGEGEVVGVDVDIRAHNRAEIEAHPLFHRICLVEGSSTSPEVVEEVARHAENRRNPLVILDSNHTHEHVLTELQSYSGFVRRGGYLVVLDTIIEDMPADFFPDRPWGKGNNPKTAVWEFLKHDRRFEIDESIHDKLLITVAPDGYLRCVSD